ncbi:MAG: hypothetical protein JKX70_08690 [Phycisphaerales bacterium]|nr:hypothetical protein [Phycisphaerales bacterium]
MENTEFDKLIEFIERCGAKGWLNKATSSSIKSALLRMQVVLEPHEAGSLDNLDIEAVVRRFANLHPDVASGSLQAYKSRSARAIAIYQDYLKDPVNWQAPTSTGYRARTSVKKTGSKAKKSSKSASVKSDEVMPEVEPHGHTKQGAGGFTYPFPLRSDHTIMISNVPRDLKTAEVDRLAAFLRSLAEDFQP